MIIPAGPNGFPTVSPTMIRRYGSAGFRLDEGEETRGCPRLFRKQYVEHEVPFVSSYALEYGSLFHLVMQKMESDDMSPEEALDASFPSFPTLGPEAYVEAQDDLNNYLARGASPTDRYGMIATERELTALLYEDEEFGPIYVRGIFDWLGIDLDNPNRLHVIDYKTNRQRHTKEEIRGDVQVRFYDLIMALCWREFMSTERPDIVVHLDEIKFDNGDIAVSYTPNERDAFRSWAIAVVRHILRDEVGKPRLNPGCAYCPVKSSCPAYRKLPDVAKQVVDLRPGSDTTLDDILSWRDQAWTMKSLLEKACKEIDADVKEQAKKSGGLVLTEYTFTQETQWETRTDMRELHALLDDEFYDVATVTKTALEALTKEWAPSAKADVMDTMKRVPVGTEIKKKKTKK